MSTMTTKELLGLKKVTVAAAAAYLQSGVTAEELRLKAQEGQCPYISCNYRTEKSKKRRYRIDVRGLILAKCGQIPEGVEL
mgnify:CR=1 FL=1